MMIYSEVNPQTLKCLGKVVLIAGVSLLVVAFEHIEVSARKIFGE